MTRRIFAVAVLCAAFASPHARAEADAVQFFSNIQVAPGDTVHDAVCFFCSVEDEGKVSGDIVVFFGNVHVASEAQHDIVNFFGRVSADDNASIGHDLVSIFGRIRLGNNVHVGEDLVAVFGSLRAGEGVTVERDRVVQPAVLFYGPFLFLVVVIVLIVREARAWRRRQFLRACGYPPYM